MPELMHDDEWDEWGDEDEFVDGSEDDDSSLTVACPNCQSEIYEDAEQCPACGEYVVHNSTGAAWAEQPVWWSLLGLAGIVMTVLWLSGALTWIR